MISSKHNLSEFSGHLTGLSDISKIWQFAEWYLSKGRRYEVTFITEKNFEIRKFKQNSPAFLSIIKKISYITGVVLVFSLIAKKYYRRNCIYTVWYTPDVYIRTNDKRDKQDLIRELAAEAQKDAPDLQNSKQVFDTLCGLCYNGFEILNAAVNHLATCYFRHYPRIECPPVRSRESSLSDLEEDNSSLLLDKDNPYDHHVYEVWRKLVLQVQ